MMASLNFKVLSFLLFASLKIRVCHVNSGTPSTIQSNLYNLYLGHLADYHAASIFDKFLNTRNSDMYVVVNFVMTSIHRQFHTIYEYIKKTASDCQHEKPAIFISKKNKPLELIKNNFVWSYLIIFVKRQL